MRRPWSLLAVALVVTVALVGGGLAWWGRGSSDDAGSDGSGGSSGSAGSPASRSPAATSSPFTTTPLSSYDTSTVAVARAAFCDRIDPRQVQAALGGAPAGQRSWGDGDRTQLATGVTDVAHEYGCEYVGADGGTASAWVFAPPIGAEQARTLAAQKVADADCTVATATFGSPSSRLDCTGSGQRSVTYRGLFGDAWLSCRLAAPASTAQAALTDRAGRWCVGAAEAATQR